MKLNINKCATAAMVKGVPRYTGVVTIDGQVYPSATDANPYRYLGILQVFASHSSTLQKQLLGEYLRRIRTIWRFRLISSRKVEMTNSWGVGVFRYYFGYIPWDTAVLTKADLMTREIMRVNNSMHCSSSVSRVYLPRKKGGRGIISVKAVYEQELVSAVCYLQTTNDPDLQALVSFLNQANDDENILTRAQGIIDNYKLGIAFSQNGPIDENGEAVSRRILVGLIKTGQWKQLEDVLMDRKIHGVDIPSVRPYQRQVRRAGFDMLKCWGWISQFTGASETEALMFAAQDGVVHVRQYRAMVLGHNVSPICPKCRESEETIEHILSSCRVYNWNTYKDRHDKVLYQIIRSVATHNNLTIPETLHWGQGQWTGQGTIGSSEKLLIQVDTLVNTSTTMSERRPDLIIRIAVTKETSICDVAVAWEPLILEREKQKRAKYEPLARDMGRKKNKQKPQGDRKTLCYR